MNYMNRTISCVMGVFALLMTACDSNMETDALTAGPSLEVVFSGEDNGFELPLQTRAKDDIGGSGDGLPSDYGTFYMMQIPASGQKPIEQGPFWGIYQVPDGESGKLTPVSQDKDKLQWKEPSIKYIFQGINVPPVMVKDATPAVTFNYDAMHTAESATGTVRFGDYKGGLEYFVGATSAAQALVDGKEVDIRFYRQVCKVVFREFTHKKDSKDNGTVLSGPLEIIFPNLPQTATFDMAHFHEQQRVTTGTGANMDFVTLNVPENVEYGVGMTWEKVQNKEEADIKQALYLIPFIFWDGKDGSRPEDQSGFFVVKYDGKTYTGNINGQNYQNGTITDKANQLYPANFCRLDIVLQDGPMQGGGSGSIIAGWGTKGEETTQHPPVPGIYSQEDAQKLLEALLSNNSENIPVPFYREEKRTDASGNEKTVKVIRLFKNIDWSAVIGTELTIPNGFVLMGQGYNVTLGDGTSIKGEQEGKLYINGVLYEDGQKLTAFLLHTFCSATANVLQSHCI